MSTPIPTPRTDAAWAKTFEENEDQCRAGNAATDMRDECATLERELTALTAERDQLRADCENETKWAAHYLAQSIADKARAERAEAKLAAASQAYECAMAIHGTVMEERDRLAEELATERARLDAGTILLTVAGERVWHCGVDLRSAIDAGMKESAK
jgi:DNA repair exonuclease SbcCD ATPase subunit